MPSREKKISSNGRKPTHKRQPAQSTPKQPESVNLSTAVEPRNGTSQELLGAAVLLQLQHAFGNQAIERHLFKGKQHPGR